MSASKSQSDLHSAIASAQEALQPKTEHKSKGHWLGKLIAMTLLLISLLFAWGLYQEFGHWLGETAPQQVRDDLRTLLLESREEVERYRSEYGELPVALPNPIHARLVRYETDGSNYQLSAQMLDTELSINDRGEPL